MNFVRIRKKLFKEILHGNPIRYFDLKGINLNGEVGFEFDVEQLGYEEIFRRKLCIKTYQKHLDSKGS